MRGCNREIPGSEWIIVIVPMLYLLFAAQELWEASVALGSIILNGGFALNDVERKMKMDESADFSEDIRWLTERNTRTIKDGTVKP